MYNVIGMYKVNNKKGFTLIEMMIMLALVGVFSTLGISNYQGSQKFSRDSRRQADGEIIRSALELYRNELGRYPVGTSGLKPNYIAAVPVDPKSKAEHVYSATPGGCNDTATKCLGYTLCIDLEKTTAVGCADLVLTNP